MEFKETLKQLRKEKGISQYKLANDVFVSRSTVAKWENGLVLPKEEVLLNLAKYFQVDVSVFSNTEEERIKVYQRMKKCQFKRNIIISGSVFLSLLMILFIILFINFNKSSESFYYESYDNGGIYTYFIRDGEICLDSYTGDSEQFSIPSSMDFGTVNGINLSNIHVDNIYIPKNINHIVGVGHFKTIDVDKNNTVYDSRDNSNSIIETKTNKLITASIDSTTIPSSVEIIGAFSFYYTNYEELVIPENVKVIESEAFAHMQNLKKISFSKGIMAVSSNLFIGCPSIEYIVLPKEIGYVSRSAFIGSNIENIYYEGEATSLFEFYKKDLNELTDYLKYMNISEIYSFLKDLENLSDAQFDSYIHDHYFYKCNTYLFSYYEPVEKGYTWHYVADDVAIWK